MMVDYEFIKLFMDKLDLSNLSENERNSFFAIMIKYLDHGRKDAINGRTLLYVEAQLDKLLNLLECMGCTKEDCVKVLSNLPSLLNTVDDLYNKYLLLGIVEDVDNSIRKDKLINKTKDYMVGISKIYARYRLIMESGYNVFSWNILMHATDSEFCKVFTRGKYFKPYQSFSDKDSVMRWLNQVDFGEFDIEQWKGLEVNKELVAKYEGKKTGISK